MDEPKAMEPTPSLSHLTSDDYDSVYEASEDTFLFLDALEQDRAFLADLNPTITLEIGPGTGTVTTFLSQLVGKTKAMHLTVDINDRAADCTRRTGAANGVVIDSVVGDLVAPIAAGYHGAIDVLLFNPPYVPTPSEEVGSRSIAASWAGGVDGREVLDRLLPDIATLLAPNGVFYLVVLSSNHPDDILARLAADGLTGESVLKRRAGIESLEILRFVKGGE